MTYAVPSEFNNIPKLSFFELETLYRRTAGLIATLEGAINNHPEDEEQAIHQSMVLELIQENVKTLYEQIPDSKDRGAAD